MDKIIACLLTIIIEVIVITCFYKKTGNKIFLALVIPSIPLNIATNFSLNTILEMIQTFSLWQYIAILIFLEVIVIVIEAIYYHVVIKNKHYAWEISFYANVISFIVGSIIFNVINLR